MGEAGLEAWIKFAASMAAPQGGITIVHRPDMLDELLRALHRRFGAVTIFPLFPRQGEPAGRVIVAARKGSRAPLSLRAGLVLHRPDGSYTELAEAVLREGVALPV
jgi:tRNA1(Val) A37 N6-methylase TrmN6